jgi:hypothetical protein
MEPPAQRLRILQSVEVDETNPDYINAKQKQQRKFKGRWEYLFSKYETMHESMSDEIDFRENKVVVDRGHLRRLKRQVNRKETILLDNLGLEAGREREVEVESESEKEDEDSEDELAPPQLPKSTRKEKQQHPAQKNTNPSPETIMQPQQPPTIQSTPQLIPNTPNPAANLLQFVQFPHTPAGQQAQTSFYATLTQTINQAVQQAVAPLFSGILPNTPSVQSPPANPIAAFTTPVANSDKIAPASDPKWFFPPLSEEAYRVPLPGTTPRPTMSQTLPPTQHDMPENQEAMHLQEEGQEHITDIEESLGETSFPVTAIIQSGQRADTPGTRSIRRSSPRVEIQRKRPGYRRSYDFTEKDDIYISKQKMLQNQTWLEIKNGRENWSDWPVKTLQQRWHNKLKTQNLHMRASTPLQAERAHSVLSEDEIAHSPVQHLPTPSSSGQEDTYEEVDDQIEDSTAHIQSCSTHFDDDERDLLSLAGTDLEEELEQFPANPEEEESFFPDADEVVLPSVESTVCIDEDTLQQGLLEGSLPTEVTQHTQHTTVEVKTEIEESIPTRKRRRTHAPTVYQVVPDTDAENEDDDVALLEPPVNEPIARDICGAISKTVKTLRRHQANPRSTRDNIRRKSASASIDLVGDDELQTAAPTTPHIKREFSTPPAASFLFSTPVPQPRSRPNMSSSGAKSTSRKAYLKQVKQAWAKGSTPGPKTAYKRRSFHTVSRKRAWSGESEDELGM